MESHPQISASCFRFACVQIQYAFPFTSVPFV
uniref:Uncharacterized protein n=1 Tax=Arundo donax TaxID=35708 RepID=A0A0A9FY11_ARUDO